MRTRLLEPLGMTATTYAMEEIPADQLAHGYVRRDDAWLEEPIDGYGALASMGGVFTSVADLARWVAGFTDAFPPRDEPDDRSPASSRDPPGDAAGQAARSIRSSRGPRPRPRRSCSAAATGTACSIADDLRLGRVVGHGGGYPGFGSNMTWHPASGIGVVAVANARYAPMYRPVMEALAVLVGGSPERVRRAVPWPGTIEARAAVERLLGRWDDAEAAALFSMNVDLDEPVARRRAAIEGLQATHGTLTPDAAVEPESHGPSHLAWWLRGERGRVRVEILMSPERPPRVQGLTIISVPEPPPQLADIARRLAASLGTPGPAWPADLRARGCPRSRCDRSSPACGRGALRAGHPRRRDRVRWLVAGHVAADG